MNDNPPTIYGDGEQTRDFTYVDNAVQANLLACEAAGVSGEVFNIGTGHSISLNQTMELFRRISGKNLAGQLEAPREGDIRDSLADISRAKESLGLRTGSVSSKRDCSAPTSGIAQITRNPQPSSLSTSTLLTNTLGVLRLTPLGCGSRATAFAPLPASRSS